MKSRLINAGLLRTDDDLPEIDISLAWKTLSHLGFPARYGGKAQNGFYEYVIVDPRSGTLLATGQGETLEMSMCQAALNAKSLLSNSKHGMTRPGPTNNHTQNQVTGENHEMPTM